MDYERERESLFQSTVSVLTDASWSIAMALSRDVMKHPKMDSEKISLPGILDVIRNEQGVSPRLGSHWRRERGGNE